MLPPRWVFPQVIEQSRNLINGAPFDHGPDNDLFADFKSKVGKLEIAATGRRGRSSPRRARR